MEIIPKSEIKEQLIINHSDFEIDDDYIGGYFSEVKEVRNLDQFYQFYHYIVYWGLPIPKHLYIYLNEDNVSKASLLEFLELQPKDEYYDEIKSIVENAKHNSSNIDVTHDIDSTEIFYELAKSNRPDLVEKMYMNGASFTDILCHSTYANFTFKVVEAMIEVYYQPSDEVIMYYIENGFGRLAILCIEHATTPEMFLDEIPRDIDFLNYLIKNKHNGNLTSNEAEDYLVRILTDTEVSKMPLDIPLFSVLYDICSKHASPYVKGELLKYVLNRNEDYLTEYFLKILYYEEMENRLEHSTIENLISNIAQSKSGYIIFRLAILGNKNYSSLLDNANDRFDDDDESVTKSNNLQLGTNDYVDIITEKFYCPSDDEEDNIFDPNAEHKNDGYSRNRKIDYDSDNEFLNIIDFEQISKNEE